MVGGAEADVAGRARFWRSSATPSCTAGRWAVGARMKLVNNMMSITSNVTTPEALMLAEASGLDPQLASKVMLGTPAGLGHMATTDPAKVLRNVSHSRLHGRPCAQGTRTCARPCCAVRLAVPTAMAARKLTTTPAMAETAVTTGPLSTPYCRERWRVVLCSPHERSETPGPHFPHFAALVLG